jgi:hypothetical protein
VIDSSAIQSRDAVDIGQGFDGELSVENPN